MNKPLLFSRFTHHRMARLMSKVGAILLLSGLCLTEHAAAQTTPVFKWWSLKRNEQDSAAFRTANVTASAATFNNLTLSNGTTVAAYGPYSSRYGQAFGASANGDGSWGTSVPGPGSNVNRTYYKQFTVTAAAGASVRVDSLVFWSAAYNTAAGRLAVSYSKDGFNADINEVTGGKGPGGPLAASANGAFTAPITLNNQNTGSAQTYRLALAGATGVTLTAGQTLTIRLYYAVGTSSAGRYALLRDVIVKSTQAVLSNRVPRAAEPLVAYPNPTQDQLTIAHPAAARGSRVAVYDAQGRVAAAVVPRASTTSTQLQLHTLPGGIYLVEYADEHQRITSRLLKR